MKAFKFLLLMGLLNPAFSYGADVCGKPKSASFDDASFCGKINFDDGRTLSPVCAADGGQQALFTAAIVSGLTICFKELRASGTYYGFMSVSK